jgi:uncharacterized membrane protein
MASVSDYVDKEYNRLNEKRSTIDDLVSAQKRAIILNESYRKRFTRYMRIVMIISAIVVVYLGVFALRKMMPAIPEMATDIFLALVFFIGAVLCINIILELMSRSVTNYDELDLPPLVEDQAAPTIT